MRITFDRSIDAAYIYISTTTEGNIVTNTYTCDPLEIGGQINLDFNSSGHLIGIEILDAKRFLAKEVLELSEHKE